MSAVLSIRSVSLTVPGRGDDLQVRVSAPTVGEQLPILLFSHGFGSSMDGYAPLVDYWAAHGFVVIQPTHLDSRRFGIPASDPRTPRIWRIRVDDLTCCLDHLATLEDALPGLAGRTQRDRVAVVGHSFGGQSASMLLGARVNGEDRFDARVTAGVLLAAGGRGGDSLSAMAREHFPYLDSSFATLRTPTLVVVGDRDDSPLSVRGPDWFVDPYRDAPGAVALLTVLGGEHMLGGISGYGVTETTDENPARVALIQRVTTAFLRDPNTPRIESAAEGRLDDKRHTLPA